MRVVTVVRPPGTPSMPRSIHYMLPVLIFSAFLTDTSFIPGIETHFGPFEIVCGFTFVVLTLHLIRSHLALTRHPLIDLTVLMLILAVLSQVNIPSARWKWSLIDLSILLFFVLFLLLLHQVVRHYHLTPSVLLRWTTYSILVVGPWILYEGAQTGGSIQAVGPFRNRAHMGNYMLTAFWIALFYRLWPGTPRRDRWAAHAAMLLSLYAVAVSGRRSVYLSLIVGLVGIGLSFLIARRGGKAALVTTALSLLVFLGGFYLYGEKYFPRTSFFRERVAMISDALTGALGSAEEADAEEGFVALQRGGAFLALRQNPLIGIGWGGFYRSPYSPTGHEMHSTPLRFLAELGVLGLALYLMFMSYLLRQSLKLYAKMRHSPYAGTYQVQVLALWSLSVSYLYNRHLSERTFWLLLVVFLALERFARFYGRVLRQRQAVQPAATGATPLPRPAGPVSATARLADAADRGPLAQPPRSATPRPTRTPP